MAMHSLLNKKVMVFTLGFEVGEWRFEVINGYLQPGEVGNREGLSFELTPACGFSLEIILYIVMEKLFVP